MNILCKKSFWNEGFVGDPNAILFKSGIKYTFGTILYPFSTDKYSNAYIWNYFYTKEEERNLKINEIIKN